MRRMTRNQMSQTIKKMKNFHLEVASYAEYGSFSSLSLSPRWPVRCQALSCPWPRPRGPISRRTARPAGWRGRQGIDLVDHCAMIDCAAIHLIHLDSHGSDRGYRHHGHGSADST